MNKKIAVFLMIVLLSGIVASSPANAASSGSGSSLKTSPSVAIIAITFDTNLPKTGAPWDHADAPIGAYAYLLKIDGSVVAVVSDDGVFTGPVTFSWTEGETHSYEWLSGQTNTKKFTWQSTSGLASDQSGTITVTTSGYINGNYAIESLAPASSEGGPRNAPAPSTSQDSDNDGIPDNQDSCPSQAETYNGYQDTDGCPDTTSDQSTPSEGGPRNAPAEPPRCTGGPSFSLAEPIPSSQCIQYTGVLYYYFTYSDKTYYATVDFIAKYGSISQYLIYLKNNNVILEGGGKYELTIYDENRNKIGSNISKSGTIAVVEIQETKTTSQQTTSAAQQQTKQQTTTQKQTTTSQQTTTQKQTTPAAQQQTKQQTTTQKQTTTQSKYLTYENKQYGFSLKYPSDWQKEEIFEKSETVPDILDLVKFHSPSGEANFNLGIIQDDKGTSQKMLDEMKTGFKDACSSIPAESNCSAEISEKRLTHKNGYGMHTTTLLVKMSVQQIPIEAPITLIMIPDSKNTWLMGYGVFSLTDQKQLLKEVTSILESFKISNYKGSKSQSSVITEQSTTPSPSVTQKQFSLNVKAIKENDQVTITITNPSSADVYGIKLTTTTGKIKNYVKVNGWDHKRINDNTVTYNTKSSPLGQSDVIKIKLKVDSKNPEITWTAYSKDQKSLGTGKARP